MPDAPLLTIREVATALHVHPNTVKRLVRRGLIHPAYRISARGDWRIPQASLDTYLAIVERQHGAHDP